MSDGRWTGTKLDIWLIGWAALLLLNGACIMADSIPDTSVSQAEQWTSSFDFEDCTFADTGSNQYFILRPGYRLTLKGVEDGDSVTLLITVLDQTEKVNGVQTRVVEERESANGELVEVSRNFYAFCPKNGSVFYFGEDVNIYEEGRVVSYKGSWRAGENNSEPGLMMPGLALIGSAYYQEMAPQIAMDRARIVSTGSTVQTPIAVFEHCLVTEETSAVEPDIREYKIYAPGVGLLRDGQLWLVEVDSLKNE